MLWREKKDWAEAVQGEAAAAMRRNYDANEDWGAGFMIWSWWCRGLDTTQIAAKRGIPECEVCYILNRERERRRT